MLTVIDELDRLVLGHRSRDDRRGAVADGLVDEVLAVVAEAGRPPEAQRGDRAGAELGIAVGLAGRERRRCRDLLGPFRLTTRLVLIEDACDGRKRLICRVALAQNRSLPNRRSVPRNVQERDRVHHPWAPPALVAPD